MLFIIINQEIKRIKLKLKMDKCVKQKEIIYFNNKNKFMNNLLMAQQIIQIVAKIQILQQEIVQKLNKKNNLNKKKNKVEILYQVLEQEQELPQE